MKRVLSGLAAATMVCGTALADTPVKTELNFVLTTFDVCTGEVVRFTGGETAWTQFDQ
jgi:hypothetical protein